MTQPVVDAGAAAEARRYDVFLSYNSVDLEPVEQLARRLAAANLSVWFDHWCISAGDDWQDELADGLARSDGCLVFVGPAGIGDWARQELKVALDRAAKRPAYRVVPVLLPGAGTPFDPTVELPPFLRLRSWLDLRSGIGGDDVVRQLVEAVHGVAPGPPSTSASDQAVCPYRGLRSFEEADHDLFFGRDGDVAQLVEKLRSSQFLAVLGPSGSGKSSLVKAGLVPALRRGRLPGSEGWRIATMRPGPRPLAELAAQLTSLGHPQPTATLLDGLSADDRSLALASAAVLAGDPGASGLLWIIDQLEELFTLVRDRTEARFVGNLVYAAADPARAVRVVVTMRADFYAKCAAFPELAQLMAAHQHLVSPLELDGWRAAIEEPAWRSGLELQSGLVETILDDAVGRPGSLPLLQEALVALWQRRRSNVLTLDGYIAAGRVAGAVAKQADAVYSEFGPAEQVAARDILLRLIQLGDGTEDTRRQAREDELLAASRDEGMTRRIIERFVEARLLTTSTGANGEPAVDVAHEALITGWPRLRSWLDEDREDLRVRQRLTDQAAEWMEQGRDDSLLYRGAQLRLAVELQERGRLELSGPERAPGSQPDEARRVAMAAAEAERVELRRLEHDRLRRRITLALVGGLAVAVVLAGLAYVQSREAGRQRERARSLSLASQSEVVAPNQLDLGLLLALQARATSDGVEARGSLLDALARAPRPARYLRPPAGEAIIAPIALSAAGDRVAAAGSDGSIHIWTPTTGQILTSWPSDAHGAVTAMTISPSGNGLALGYQDGTVVVHDAATGSIIASIAAHGAAVTSLAFASETSAVSAARDGPVVTTWAGGRLESRPAETDDLAVSVLAVSPDGARLATASTDAVRLWDLATGAPIGAPLLDASSAFPPGPRTTMTWTDDGARLAVNVGRLQVFDGVTGTALTGLLGPDTTPDVLAGGGSSLVVADGREVLMLSDEGNARTPTPLLGHTGPVRSVGTSRDGSVIVSAASDSIIVWHAAATSPLARTLVPKDATTRTANAVIFLADGQQLASTVGDGVTRWDAATGSELAPLQAPGGPVTRLAFSPATGTVVGGTFDGALVAWDAATGTILQRRDGLHPNAVRALAVSADGQSIASADSGGTIVIWDADSLIARAQADQEGGVRALAFSPDGTLLASGGDDRTVRLWQSSDVEVVATLSGHTGMVGSVAFSPDGALLASGGDDARVRLWDVSGHRELVALAGHSDFVLGLRFSPDGRRLVSTGEDATVILWDVEHRVAIGHPLRTASTAFVDDLDLSPDGRTAAGIQGQNVVLWDVDESSWLDQACAIADRPFTDQERAQYLGDRRPAVACPAPGAK